MGFDDTDYAEANRTVKAHQIASHAWRYGMSPTDVLALDPAPVALNREIGVFLLTVLAGLPETPVADAVQALDEIFDIYADKSYACDETFWSDGFYKHLEEVKVKVSKSAKGVDKRKEIELRSRADEAALNLQRFLSYKKREKKH